MLISHAVSTFFVLDPNPGGASIENHLELLLLGTNPNVRVQLNIEESVQVHFNEVLCPFNFLRIWTLSGLLCMMSGG